MTIGSVSAGTDATPAGRERRSFVLLGTGVVIEADADAGHLLDRVATLLGPFAVGSTDGPAPLTFTISARGDDVTVVAAGAEVATGAWPHVEAQLLARLNAAAIAGYRGLAVHAGVVARGDRVVCFPGVSGAGKSTMTAACLGAGFSYVSDEALCIDRTTRRVEPYPRPLALSTTSCELLGHPVPPAAWAGPHDAREVILTASDLGATPVDATVELELADIVELQRGSTELHLESVHRARAVPALLAMSFNHFKEPDTTVEVVGALARDVRVWRLHHTDPVAAAELLARELT